MRTLRSEVRVGCQRLVRWTPSVRQTRVSVGRRVVRMVVMLRVLILKVMVSPDCMRLHARGGDGEGVLVGTC